MRCRRSNAGPHSDRAESPIMPNHQLRPAAVIDWTRVALPGVGTDTVALITGGSGAIGYRAAEVLVGFGARVAIMGRSPRRVAELAAKLPGTGEGIGVPGDVGVEADAMRAVETVTGRWGRLDLLIQSAAVGGGGPLLDVTAEEIDAMFGVNVRGMMLMAKHAARPMVQQGGGKIVNVSSVAGHQAGQRVVYGTTKAAISFLTRQMAVNLAPYGINVNCVSPGLTPTVLTPFDAEPGGAPEYGLSSRVAPPEQVPLRRYGTLDDYVGPILFLASDLADYMTGVDIVVEGGVSLASR
ncbi:MAG: SDR family oxidoreductase [Dehalococcoidia bacterium]|nr:SDR family oxidoreductase [Dehalococcoidia bacterium]